jgi:hypothetical protein
VRCYYLGSCGGVGNRFEPSNSSKSFSEPGTTIADVLPVRMITGKSATVPREQGRLCTATFKLFLAASDVEFGQNVAPEFLPAVATGADVSVNMRKSERAS